MNSRCALIGAVTLCLILMLTTTIFAQQLPSSIMQSSRVQEAIKSGRLTPEQMKYIQQGKGTSEEDKEKQLERARLIQREMRGEKRPRTLTPDEIEAGRRFLENKKREAIQEDDFVFLRGNVFLPGQYEYKPGMRVLDIIPDEFSLDKNTFFDYAVVKRFRIDVDEKEEKGAVYSVSETGKRIKIIAFDLGRLILNKDQTHNILLRQGDEIYIYSKATITALELPEAEKAEPSPERALLHIFGHKFFSAVPSTFAPITAVPVSKDYVVGPGDEIRILMWGRMDADYQLEVDSEGVINFPKIGPLTLAGLTFGETKSLIIRRAEAITGVNVSVSMGRLRTIQVFVLGEAKSPGLYTVSSLAMVTNALLSSGGPTRLGSLRNVQLKRSGKLITTIDLYDFLMKGDMSADSRLMPGDVIFIPQAGPMVSITGNVKRPAIYELRNQESLRSALRLAGGLKPDAFSHRVQIERNSENMEQIILDIPLKELQKREVIPLKDGDLIRIFPIIPETANAVYLSGNVLRPGPREFKPGIRILDILPDVDSLDEETYFDYALVRRYHRDEMKAELIPFNLGRLLRDRNEADNVRLMPRDEVTVFSRSMLQEKAYAEVKGEIRKPGNYLIVDRGMRIRDLILKAGNVTRDAYLGDGHLFRTDPDTYEMTIRRFNVQKALADDPQHSLSLVNMDSVIIHSRWEYQEKYTVVIQGMVTHPDEYPYATEMTVSDLIFVAGNVRTAAYLAEAELTRYKIIEGKRIDTSILSFNVEKALAGDPAHNLTLQPMDVVNIKEIPDWWEKKKSVILSGEVMFPGTYPIRKEERLSEVIERAGGYTDPAYLRGAMFTRESVRVVQQQRIREMMDRLERESARLSSREIQASLSAEDLAAQTQLIESQEGLIEKLKKTEATGRVVISLLPLSILKGNPYDLILEDGDTLFIPSKMSTVNVIGAVFNPGSMVFDESRPEAKYYLAKTGGTTKNAEEDQMYIIRVDGSVISKKGKSWFGISWSDGDRRLAFRGNFANSKLNPGDTIIVPERLVRPNYMRDIKDITQILYQIAIAAGATILIF